MTRRESTFVRRKAEDETAEPERTEGYDLHAHKDKATGKGIEWGTNITIFDTYLITLTPVVPYGSNMKSNHNGLRSARKKGNELSSVIQIVRP